jgi:hypothetical protein
MRVKHTSDITARCPVNGKRDCYRVSFLFERFVAVEELLKDIHAYSETSIFQEDLTQRLADRWSAVVRTVGAHGMVITTCVARPKA